MSELRGWVTAGESGPVIRLSGEADVTTVAKLTELTTAQLSGGARHLTIDVSELAFVDSVSIRVLVLTARTLKERGGGLTLLRPQPQIARIVELMGADQLITIQPEAKPRQV